MNFLFTVMLCEVSMEHGLASSSHPVLQLQLLLFTSQTPQLHCFPTLNISHSFKNQFSFVCLHQCKMLCERHTTNLGELSMEQGSTLQHRYIIRSCGQYVLHCCLAHTATSKQHIPIPLFGETTTKSRLMNNIAPITR